MTRRSQSRAAAEGYPRAARRKKSVGDDQALTKSSGER
jgi:hypothetical protein